MILDDGYLSVQESSDPLALEQFLSFFLMSMVGILIAVIFLLLERIYFKYIRATAQASVAPTSAS